MLTLDPLRPSSSSEPHTTHCISSRRQPGPISTLSLFKAVVKRREEFRAEMRSSYIGRRGLSTWSKMASSREFMQPYKLTWLQRGLLAPYFGMKAIMDPARGDYVAGFGDVGKGRRRRTSCSA